MSDPVSLPPPGPRPLPVVGNLHSVLHQGMIAFYEGMQAEYGDVFRLQFPGQSTVMVAHPDGLERILSTNRANYIKGSAYDTTREVLGDNLVTLEGARWKSHRRLAQPSFHRKAIEDLVEIMADAMEEELDALQERVVSGGTMDAHAEMTRLTLRVVIEALFGQGLHDARHLSPGLFGSALKLLSEDQNKIVKLPRYVPTPGNLRFKRKLREMDEAVYDIIAAARKRDDKNEGTLLNMLLHSTDADTGLCLTDRELRDEILTLFVAGHETTALTLSWWFVLLGEYPQVLAKMREEVETVLGDRRPTFADVGKLVYLRQVTDEILRLRPPAWVIARNVVAKDEICGYAVEPGEIVVLGIKAVQSHPDYWEDPQRFDPDRFHPDRVDQIHRWAYLPFSKGPRMCIGNTFALVESQIALAMLLQRGDYELLPRQDIQPKAEGTMRPSGPVQVRVTWRDRAVD